MEKAMDMEHLFVGAVTVGERGQVVIPAKARESLGIEAGEKLLVFLNPSGHGVAFIKVAMLEEAAAMIKRLAEELTEEDTHEHE
jgi:AbrB family looped-hinge helix DNA binding protein